MATAASLIGAAPKYRELCRAVVAKLVERLAITQM